MNKSSAKKSTPRSVARGYAEGGEVYGDEADEAGVGEVGTAAQLLSQLEAQEPRRAKKVTLTPKRVRGRSEGAARPEGMGMGMESLGSVRELVKMATEKGSAKEQMQELARLYQLRAATFNQPALTGQTLDKKTLGAERFKEGGEAKKPQGGRDEQFSFMDPEAALLAGRGDVPAQRMTGREFAQQALYGVGELPYLYAGAPVDLVSLALMPFGYNDPKPFMGSEDIKARMTRAGIRPPDTQEERLQGPRMAAELLSSFTNPAGATRSAVLAAEKGARGAGDAARMLEDATVGNVQRARIRSAADKVPQDTAAEKALDAPVTRIMERGGTAADLLVPSTPAPTTQPSRVAPPASRVKAPAPASDLGFYSAAEQAALNLPRKEGTGAAFLNDLMKGPDVKKEELSAMGLDEFLKSKPRATRQEVQAFIASNRLDVREVQRGNLYDQAVNKQQETANKLANLINAQDGGSIRLDGTQGKVFSDEALYALQDRTTAPSQFPLEFQVAANSYLNAYEAAKNALNTSTKFDSYQLPGGQNYREILLTIPFKEPAMPKGYNVTSMQYDDGTVRYFANTPTIRSSAYKTEADAMTELQRMTNSLKDFRKKTESYKSPHFDEPNILAHLRVNDRVDADGKKMLLIEEIQSDWHQAGRDRGYRSDMPRVDYDDPAYVAARDRSRELLNEFNANNVNRARQDEIAPLLAEAREAEQQFVRASNKRNAAVPDAPFKDTWHQLTLKRALKYAADNGYDRVGLTTGKQQAQRYDLSKQVDNISYEPTKKGFYINVISTEGRNVLNGDYAVKELEGIVGKELTRKMLAKQGVNEFDPKIEPDLAEVRRLDGVDLKVGGEGMKKYYDEIYPGFLAKQAKKYGAQVGEINIKTGNAYAQTKGTPAQEAVRYIDITPEMKGAVPYAKGGEVNKNTAFIKAHS